MRAWGLEFGAWGLVALGRIKACESLFVIQPFKTHKLTGFGLRVDLELSRTQLSNPKP